MTVVRNPKGLPPEWADVAAVVMVGREREVGGKNTSSVHYYITSLRCSPKKLAGYIRDFTGALDGAFYLSAGLLAAAVALCALLRPPGANEQKQAT